MLAAFGRLQKLQMPVQVQRCACGAEHLLLLATTGLVFASGRNSHGQLGLEKVQHAASPACIQALSHLQACDVAAGSAHSCAVTTFGNLFTWGDNQHGQLGDGSLAPRQTPELVGEVLGVVRAAAAEVAE
ncbi:unnamed protein product [Effrenium voratum]|nr:unnamed protein product [Effrenium voratum]